LDVYFSALDRAWYVTSSGDDSKSGADAGDNALRTVDKALELIAIAYAKPSWTAGAAATIVVIGTSGDTKTILIDDTQDKDLNTIHTDEYPPITLRGLSPTQPGILTADKDSWPTPARVLEVTNGAQVTLGTDLTITGGGKRETTSTIIASGVYVTKPNSTFTMNGGTITGNVTTSASAVTIANFGAFRMNSGKISHNPSRGVSVTTDATFIMNGGVISDNEAAGDGGGAIISSRATFTMNSGTISANSTGAGWNGGGILVSNGGGLFTMNGGAITGNISSRQGGGVYMSGNTTLIMNGGTISDNTAREFGGGVYLRWDATSFTMHGGIISGNTAVDGGGGVALDKTTGTPPVFKKLPASGSETSGIIYGNDGSANRNKATLADTSLEDLGHAVYIKDGPKTRETTVMPDQHLDTDAAGDWVD
jgi:hypothetical protein